MSDGFFFNFGNPMKEHTIKIPDKDILKEVGLLEGDSNTAEGSFEKTKHALEKKVDRRELKSDIFYGGSGPNVASQLSIRGIESIVFAGFGRGEKAHKPYRMGLPSYDSIGHEIIMDFNNYGVHPLVALKNKPSCEIFTLNHEWDNNRTFSAELGAAAAVEVSDVPFNYIELSSHVYLTQYKLHDSPAVSRAIAKKAWEVNKDDSDLGKIVIDFSSETAMEGGAELLEEFLERKVYMILANVGESKYRFDVDIYESKKDRLNVARELLKSCDIAILKLNDKGALIANKKGFYYARAVPVTKTEIKTFNGNENGLGDALASGVLEVLIKRGHKKDSLQKAISLGVERSREVYLQPGPKKRFGAEPYNRIIKNSYPQLTPWQKYF